MRALLAILLLLRLLISRPEQILLYVHLLRAGGRFKHAQFNIEDLKESTRNIECKYPKGFRPDARKWIDSLYYARRKEIQYENGECGKPYRNVPLYLLIRLQTSIPQFPFHQSQNQGLMISS